MLDNSILMNNERQTSHIEMENKHLEIESYKRKYIILSQ